MKKVLCPKCKKEYRAGNLYRHFLSCSGYRSPRIYTSLDDVRSARTTRKKGVIS